MMRPEYYVAPIIAFPIPTSAGARGGGDNDQLLRPPISRVIRGYSESISSTGVYDNDLDLPRSGT